MMLLTVSADVPLGNELTEPFGAVTRISSGDDAGFVGGTVPTTWSFAHHEQRFRAPGELIAGNLNRVAHVHHIGDDRPREARHLLAPVPVAVDRREWRHTVLTLAPVEPLILDEIREVFAFPRL